MDAVQRPIHRIDCGDFSKMDNRFDSSNSAVLGRFKAICAIALEVRGRSLSNPARFPDEPHGEHDTRCPIGKIGK